MKHAYKNFVIVLLTLFIAVCGAAVILLMLANGKETVTAHASGPFTDTIYWGLEPNESDSSKYTLIITSVESDTAECASKGSFSGTTGFENYYTAIPWYSNRSNIKAVETKGTVKPMSTAYWFNDFQYCSSINLSNLDTTYTSYMQYMFRNSNGLDKSTFLGFNTINVSDMSNMFDSCVADIIDVSGFNTASVRKMNRMFSNCYVKELDVSNFKTQNVTSMDYMFYSCRYVKTLDLSNFDTTKVTSASGMLYSLRDLESVKVSSTMASAMGKYDTGLNKALYSVDGTEFAVGSDGKYTLNEGTYYTTKPAHTLTHVEAKAATCTETGNIEYWYCSVCEKNFADESEQTEITESVTVSALGHDWEHHEGKAPTETESGYNEYDECKRCGESTYEEIPALNETTEGGLSQGAVAGIVVGCVLGVICIVLVVYIFVYRKRKR